MEMRILFTCWPAYGHLLPMIPLAKAAHQAGHEVVISSGSDITGLIEQRGFTAHRSGPTLAQSYAYSAEHSPRFSQMSPQDEMAASGKWLFGAGGVRRAEDLLPHLTQAPPDVLIHDPLEFGGPSVAERLGIPHATHSYGPIVPGSDFFAAIVSDVLTEADLPDPVPSIFARPYMDICPPSLQPQGIAPWKTSSPLRPSPGEVGRDDRLPPGFADLPHGRTIYLTLGTIMNQQPDVFRTVLDGCRRHPVNVVTTVGPGVDAADLGSQPVNVLVLPYLAQAVLLPHCDAVISHAGAGTMLGALCLGLPQLCLPQGTDQPFNTAALIRTGAGLALSPHEITADAVADAVDRILDESAIRQAAQAIQAEIGAMPTPDQVVRDVLEPTLVASGDRG